MVKANAKALEKMEAKKSNPASGKKAVAFFGEVKGELKKVDWTSKDELKVYTKVVLASTFLFGFFIYLVDLTIQGGLFGIHSIVRAIFG